MLCGDWLTWRSDLIKVHQQALNRVPVALFSIHIQNAGRDAKSRKNRLTRTLEQHGSATSSQCLYVRDNTQSCSTFAPGTRVSNTYSPHATSPPNTTAPVLVLIENERQVYAGRKTLKNHDCLVPIADRINVQTIGADGDRPDAAHAVALKNRQGWFLILPKIS